jgi:hypothetical protein
MGVCRPPRRTSQVGHIFPARFVLDFSAREMVHALLTVPGALVTNEWCPR